MIIYENLVSHTTTYLDGYNYHERFAAISYKMTSTGAVELKKHHVNWDLDTWPTNNVNAPLGLGDTFMPNPVTSWIGLNSFTQGRLIQQQTKNFSSRLKTVCGIVGNIANHLADSNLSSNFMLMEPEANYEMNQSSAPNYGQMATTGNMMVIPDSDTYNITFTISKYDWVNKTLS